MMEPTKPTSALSLAKLASEREGSIAAAVANAATDWILKTQETKEIRGAKARCAKFIRITIRAIHGIGAPCRGQGGSCSN